jgi:hypothetical protein
MTDGTDGMMTIDRRMREATNEEMIMSQAA